MTSSTPTADGSLGSGAMSGQLFQIRSPGDGVYRVRLVGEDVANVANVSFAGAGDVQEVRLQPGAYTAWIEPLGAAAGFRQAIELTADQPVQLRDEVGWGPSAPGRRAPARPSWRASPADSAEETTSPAVRSFALGVSVDTQIGVFGGWTGEVPRTFQSFADQRSLAFLFRRPANWRERPRWRLTAGVEDRRLWRVPLPLFRGGLQIAFTPVRTPNGPDLALSLMPRHPIQAALVASLNQLFGVSATEVVEATLARATPVAPPEGPPVAEAIGILTDELDCPWSAAAAALLMARCGDIAEVEGGVRKLAADFPWFPDAAVAMAWADAAAEGPRGDQEIKCFEGVQEARRRGAPYFIASDALVRDMLTALGMSAESRELRAAANEELAEWTRRSRLRMRSGPYLSWEESSFEPGADQQLGPPDYFPIAAGHIVDEGAEMFLKSERTPPPAATSLRTTAARPATAPGLGRRVTHPDDPHKGRFGGTPHAGGYDLSATFGRGSGGWVRITLTVTAPPDATPDLVQLHLHDTFDPDRFELPFEDGVAELVTMAYGGFTVGAWIPDAGVELELDLAELPHAPRVIVEN